MCNKEVHLLVIRTKCHQNARYDNKKKFTICVLQRILFGRGDQEGRGRWVMWYVWGGQKYIMCLVEKMKERDHLENLFVGNGII